MGKPAPRVHDDVVSIGQHVMHLDLHAGKWAQRRSHGGEPLRLGI